MRSPSTSSEMDAVDGDFWGQAPTLDMLGRYLAREWREYLRLGDPTARKAANVTFKALPESPYWRPGGALRGAETAPDPVSDAQRYLDRHRIVRAVLNPGTATGVSGLTNATFAAEVARATNEWLISEWLPADDRFVGSIVVGARDARLAAAEIRRLAPNPRVAQIIVAYPPCLLGDRSLDPLYEAADESALPIALQATGAYAGINRGMAAVGNPTSVFEYEAGWRSMAQPHLVSMIAAGTFKRYPNLRLALCGFGAAWLPSLVWGLDMDVKAGRVELPSQKQLPSEVIADRVNLSTVRLEVPSDSEQLAAVLSTIDAGKLLFFASGYPREDDVGPEAVRRVIPAEWLDPVLHDNARRLFRLGM
jgi:predicted TIM-barrel fold metal-dependent hydrolase